MNKITLIIILFSICSIIQSCDFEPSWVPKERKRLFNEQVGTYKFDLNQTIHGPYAFGDSIYNNTRKYTFKFGPYAKDSALYRKLTITFKADSTFHFNMSVPFCYDTFGVWVVSCGNPDIDGYNTIFFSSDKSLCDNRFHPDCGAQFGKNGSVLEISNLPPKKGNVPVMHLLFKKVKK